jgi:hypothetical protein
MSSNEVTEQQVTALIDELFKSLAETHLEQGFFRIKTNSGEAIKFSISSSIGDSDHIVELNRIARLYLQEYPPQTYSDLALVTLRSFVVRLIGSFLLSINNTNDISRLEMTETYHVGRAAAHGKSKQEENALRTHQKSVLERVKLRNATMLFRRHEKPSTVTSITRLQVALMVLRIKKPDEEITIPKIAIHLGCENDAVYRSIRRYGISTKVFLNVDPTKWKPKRVDKLEKLLSKIKPLSEDEI